MSQLNRYIITRSKPLCNYYELQTLGTTRKPNQVKFVRKLVPNDNWKIFPRILEPSYLEK